MRRFLLDLLLFSLVALAAHAVLVTIAGTCSPAGGELNLRYLVANDQMLLNRVREAAELPPTKILVLGSSHAYRGMDPRVFAAHDLRIFNLGSAGQTPLQMEALLRHHLAARAPRLTLIETYPEVFTHRGIECTLDLLANERLGADVVCVALRTMDITVWNTLLYTSIREAFGPPKPMPAPTVATNGDRYVSGGFVEHHESGFTSKRSEPFHEWRPLPEQLETLRRVVGTLQQAGSRVVLFRAPVLPGNRYVPEVEARIDSTLSAMPGVPYYDLSELFAPTDTALFYDDHHLDQQGVERFNAELIRQLREDGVL
jgi:hypothetical protein